MGISPRLRDNSRMTGELLRETLDAQMKRAGYTAHTLSVAAGLKPGYIADILRKSGEPGVLSFYAIARTLHLSIEQLIGALPVPGHASDEGMVIPQAGDIIHDANEAAILGVWRKAGLLGKTSILTTLGFTDIPSVADLDIRLGRSE